MMESDYDLQLQCFLCSSLAKVCMQGVRFSEIDQSKCGGCRVYESSGALEAINNAGVKGYLTACTKC